MTLEISSWVMENISHTLPVSSLCPSTLGEPLPFSSSPQQISLNGRISLPLSPISFPPSPTSLSPATADYAHTSSPLSHCAAFHCLEGQNTQYLKQESISDQDDLTCLSWLHQRGDLLPLQPLAKMTPLPQQESCTPDEPLPPPASSKPPYSFSSLIFMAIEDSPHKRLPVKDIYEWIVNNFPYYRTATGGWRNSVRHNLSLSKSFRRIQRDKSQVGTIFLSKTPNPDVLDSTTTLTPCWREAVSLYFVLLPPDVSTLFDRNKTICAFVAVGGEGITVVCVSRLSSGAPGGAEEDPQLSQHKQQSDQQACSVSNISYTVSSKADSHNSINSVKTYLLLHSAFLQTQNAVRNTGLIYYVAKQENNTCRNTNKRLW